MVCFNIGPFKTAGIVGATFVVVGAVFLGSWAKLFDFVLNQQLVLSKDSYSYSLWQETPIPVYIEFYFFNWTNADDIHNVDPNARKPKLTQLGPYVFKEQRKKVVLSWNDNNTVSFLQNKTWHYEPSLSKGSLDDLVTTINIPAVTAAFAIRDYPKWIKYILNEVMVDLESPLAVTKTVSEFLFDGYSDPLINISQKIPDGILPITIPYDKFGWFYTRNGSETYDGVFNMFTGKGDIRRFGKVAYWNYENPTSAFDKTPCGVLNGSAGEFFLTHPKKDGSISLFSPDVCRMLTLTYKEEVVVEGIRGYRYWGDEHVFDNVSVRPERWCYCPSGRCAPHGAIDVSTCKWGAPAFITFPHFFNADPSYREAVDGMVPNENLHQMYVDLEKHTGIPLQVAASLQINILLQPFPDYKLFEQVPKIYFPIIWFKERARIDDNIGPQVRLVSRIPTAGYLIFGTILCIGLAIMIVAYASYLVNGRHQGKSDSDLKLVGT